LPPTTTIPVVGVLREDGIGAVTFGTEAEAVIFTLAALYGPPTADTGWQPSIGPFGTCDGSESRGVSFGGLTAIFGDSSLYRDDGERHFFAYTYTGGTPPGMTTPNGITVGSTVAEVKAAYGDGATFFEDPDLGTGFYIGDVAALAGNVTSLDDAGTVTEILGGAQCVS
jgi:hypothetical protein